MAFGVPQLFDRLVEWVPGAIHGVSVATALLAVATAWLLRPTGEGGAKASLPRRMAFALAAPLAVVLIVGGVATLNRALVRRATDHRRTRCIPASASRPGRFACPPRKRSTRVTGAIRRTAASPRPASCSSALIAARTDHQPAGSRPTSFRCTTCITTG